MMTYQYLKNVISEKGAGYLCLIDPDNHNTEQAVKIATTCEYCDVDALLVGGSIMFKNEFEHNLRKIKEAVNIPVIIFPGIFHSIFPYADALLMLSMMSSRNPDLLIGEQVKAAPLIKSYGLETIPTAYLLIESGSLTSVQYMSHSFPIPRAKTAIAVAHSLAAQYLGMKLIYLEAGSGAKNSVPNKMIREVKNNVDIPIIVGGGIRTPKEAKEKVDNGADFIVTGTVIENNNNEDLIKEFSKAIHK